MRWGFMLEEPIKMFPVGGTDKKGGVKNELLKCLKEENKLVMYYLLD